MRTVWCAGGSRAGFFSEDHPSPPDPRFQERAGWYGPIAVEEPTYDRTIRDRITTGEVYKLVSPVDPNQYFLVTNEKHNASYWQNNWPADGGLQIYHVNLSGSSSWPQNPYVDLEVRPGKYGSCQDTMGCNRSIR